MAVASAEQLIRRLKQIHESDQLRLLGDGALLERFVAQKQERAFEELLRRHGPMVWNVCARSLGRGADAEDAFQAVFLLLVRKASSLRRPQQVGGWLHATARKVARRALQQRLTRGGRHSHFESVHEPAAEPPAPRDWEPLLDAAIDGLPQAFREALILCELQQLSRAEAARLLGVNENTLSSRLARARSLLKTRLERTGVALPAVGLGGGLTMPATLCSATAHLATQTLGAGGAPAALLPAGVLTLMHGGISSMFIAKWFTGLALMAFGLGTLSTGQAPPGPGDGKGSPPAAKQENPKKAPTPQPPAAPPEPVKDAAEINADELQGRWAVKSFKRGEKVVTSKEQSFLDPEFKPHTCIVEQGQMTWLVRSSGLVTPYGVTPGTLPRRIDVLLTEKPEQKNGGNSILLNGSFQLLERDRLAMRFNTDRTRRPTFEEDDPNDAVIAIEMERVPAPAKVDPEWADLVGRWSVEQTLYSGRPNADITEITIEPGRILFSLGRVIEWAELKLDRSKSPPWMTIQFSTPEDGRNPKLINKAIFDLKGDLLRLAMMQEDGGNFRPSEFESPAESKIMLFTARRGPSKAPRADAPRPVNYTVPVPVPAQYPTPTDPLAVPPPLPAFPGSGVYPTPLPPQPASVAPPPPQSPPVPQATGSVPPPQKPAPSPVPASAPSAPAAEPIVIGGSELLLPIDLGDVKQRGQIRELRLWISRGKGDVMGWDPKQPQQTIPGPFPDDFQLRFVAPQDGEYGFAIQSVNAQGDVSPPSSELEPAFRVKFVTPPKPPGPVVPKLKVQTPRSLPDVLRENESLRKQLNDLQKRLEALEKAKK